MFVFFHVRAARRYFILLEAVDGESQVYLRVRSRCAARFETTPRFGLDSARRVVGARCGT